MPSAPPSLRSVLPTARGCGSSRRRSAHQSCRCADADVAAVSKADTPTASRCSVALTVSSTPLQPAPQGLCIAAGDRHIAVAECYNRRVGVFTMDGLFTRHVGVRGSSSVLWCRSRRLG